MIKFPQHLPLPTIDGYSIKPDDAIIRTDMESGPRGNGGVLLKLRLK